jgi:hypothetical protein
MLSRKPIDDNKCIMGFDHLDNRKEFISNYIEFSLCREKLIEISSKLIQKGKIEGTLSTDHHDHFFT